MSLRLNSVHDITINHQHIFVSPHFDDVAYSCGGTIGALVNNGQQPLVITVFAGIPSLAFNPLKLVSRLSRPLAFRVQRGMGFSLRLSLRPAKIVALRRQEDARAFDYLGADYLWLDYLDSIYRGGAQRYTTIQQLLGGEIHAEDRSISQRLSQELAQVYDRQPASTWYFPLGVGRHVDHQVVFAAAEGLVERGATVKFYEDFPYVAAKGALQARLNEVGKAFTPTQVGIGDTLNQRVEVAALYASQIKMSFGEKGAMYKAIKDYTCSILSTQTAPLEQYWLPT